MDKPGSRGSILGRIGLAHAVGLWVAGMAGTIGTTSGFSFAGGGLGLFLGGILSLPWIIALVAVVWFWGGWIERHPFAFVLIGLVVVCGTYALLAGGFFDAVAISSVTSSLAYVLLTLWKPRRSEVMEEM